MFENFRLPAIRFGGSTDLTPTILSLLSGLTFVITTVELGKVQLPKLVQKYFGGDWLKAIQAFYQLSNKGLRSHTRTNPYLTALVDGLEDGIKASTIVSDKLQITSPGF